MRAGGLTGVEPEPEQEADGAAGERAEREQRVEHAERRLIDHARHVPGAPHLMIHRHKQLGGCQAAGACAGCLVMKPAIACMQPEATHFGH